MFQQFAADYPAYEIHLARAQLVLFMLGMGATLRVADFTRVGRQPAAFLLGMFGVFVISPAVALAFGLFPDLPAGIGLGLLLVAALPGGTLSNVLTYFARGNVALSIGMSATAALMSVVTVPLILRLFAGQYVPEGFRLPAGEIILEIVLCLLIPLGLGMLAVRNAPAFAGGVNRWAVRAGFVLFAVTVVGSLGSGRLDLDKYGFWVPAAIVLFTFTIQQLGMIPMRISGWPPGDEAAVGIEVTVRNVFLGLLVNALLFPDGATTGGDVLFVLLFYGGTSLIMGAPLALRIRRKIRRIEREAVRGD